MPVTDDELLSLSRVKDAISLCVHCCRGGATEVAYHRLLQWRESIRAAEAGHGRAKDRIAKLEAALALAADRLDVSADRIDAVGTALGVREWANEARAASEATR